MFFKWSLEQELVIHVSQLVKSVFFIDSVYINYHIDILMDHFAQRLIDFRGVYVKYILLA